MHVLIVEDDAATRQMLERGLTEELFRVEAVADCLAAVAAARPGVFDIIILDVMLPGGDGFEVCRRLRAQRVDTPVILLTSRSAVEDRVSGLDVGADDYLAKPFAFSELLARIRALTRRGRTRHLDRVLRYGPLELDLVDRVVKINGQVVMLTAMEFRLLEYLVMRAEALVTRDELMQHVWGSAVVERDSNVIDVYVGYLRKKLKPAGIPLLRTVRRFGYSLKKGRV